MMNKGFEVFNIDPSTQNFQLDNAIGVLEAKLNPSWIKQRTQGSATLSYIGGHTVIRLLNKAFNYQWSFEIVTEEIIESLPKPMYDGWGKNRKAVMENGVHKLEAQPPVAKVLGRLTVPGLGIKEQYGSKVLIGGATEQESAFKAASTDSLKKCASLFGIGLELYGDDEGFETTDEAVEAAMPQIPATPVPQTPTPIAQPIAPPKPTAPPATQSTGATTASQSTAQLTWDPTDIQRLKDLKAIMGITDNGQLDPFVREFLDTEGVTWQHITPANIKAFNIYLGKKASAMQ